MCCGLPGTTDERRPNARCSASQRGARAQSRYLARQLPVASTGRRTLQALRVEQGSWKVPAPRYSIDLADR
jgi:hypothetical protein